MTSPIVGDLALVPGRWIGLGITHWHCVVRAPEGVNDPRRLSHDRMLAERVSSSVHVATSPDEVLAWLAKTTDELAVHEPASAGRRDIWLRMVEHGMDVHTMLSVSESRIVHVSVYALTAKDCTIH